MICPFTGAKYSAQCKLYAIGSNTCAFETIARSLVNLSDTLELLKKK